jgi:hypothetical protein
MDAKPTFAVPEIDERNFLDRVYLAIEKAGIAESKDEHTLELICDTNIEPWDAQSEFSSSALGVSPKTQGFLNVAEKFEHSIFLSVLAKSRNTISIMLIPVLFEEFYNRRFPHPNAEKSGNKEIGLFVFLLTEDGALSRKTPISGDTPYSMKKDSRRHRVMKALVSSKSERYCPTQDLAEQAGCKEGEFRRTCGEIRIQVEKHFSGINSKDIIDSKARSGYRINPKAKVIEIP